MRLYYDSSGQVLYTIIGDNVGPETSHIVLPDQDLGDLTGWVVQEGELVRSPNWATDQLSKARAAASLSKADLLIRLATFGILTPAEAQQAASGVIPPSMETMMETLPPEAQMAARIKWAADNEISRNHQVIVMAAYALGLSDELVDQIFEVSISS